MLRVAKKELTEVISTLTTYETKIMEIYTEQYRNAYILSQSAYYRGQTADAYKKYVTAVTINFINGLRNIATEIKDTAEKMSDCFESLVKAEADCIDTELLDEVISKLNLKLEDFNYFNGDLKKVNFKASVYITLLPINDKDIEDDYGEIIQEIKDIKSELQQSDAQALALAEKLYQRILDFNISINKIKSNYISNGKICFDKVNDISNQAWFTKEKCLDKDESSEDFSYKSGAEAWAEGQWAKGAYSDTYMYAGYSVKGYEYNALMRNGVFNGYGKASVFSTYFNAQATDYARFMSNIDIGKGEGIVKAGFSDKYKGFSLSGDAVAARAKANVILGTDNLNLNGTAKAELLSATGFVKCEFEDNGDVSIGFDGDASAAKAEATAGISIFNVPVKTEQVAGENVTKTTSIFGIKVTARASVGAGAGAYYSSKTVYEWKNVNVKAVRLKIKGAFGLGGAIDVTVPGIGFD